MAAPTLPVLGASTHQRDLCFEFKISGVYTMVGGVTNSQFQPSTANWVTNTDQAGQGGTSQDKTAYTHTGNLTLDRKRATADPTKYDAGQEFLRLAALAIGPANTVEFRVFEYDFSDPTGANSPRVEAYHGFAGVEWVPAGGDMNADSTVAVTLNGQGKLDEITHPYPAGAAVPTVTSVTPANLAVAGGTLVEVTGNGFTGTTGVTIGGTAVTAFDVISDTIIEVEAPAHAAASGLAVVVTNAAGPSVGGPTVTYA
jgi:hypothetical protein